MPFFDRVLEGSFEESKVMKLDDIENVDDGDSSWQELMNEAEATTYSESERLNKLTEIVLPKFINRVVTESRGKMMMTVEKKGTNKHCQESGSLSSVVEGEKEDYFGKQKKRKTTGDNGKKKQKTSNTNKEKKPKDNQKKGQDPNNVKPIEMGLEPPPYMPQEFKDSIQNLGGTEIELVLQKFIQVTDLKSSQNRFSMSLKQVRSEFLNEAEKEKLDRREAIEVVFIEPCRKVSKLNLNKWEIGASWSYVLNGSWYKNVVKNNGDSLKPKAVVQVWSFRLEQNSQLGFAMIKVRDGEDGHVIN